MKSARTSLLRLFFVLLQRVNCGDLIIQGEPNLFVRETLVGSVTFCVGTESGPNARSVRLEHSQPT